MSQRRTRRDISRAPASVLWVAAAAFPLGGLLGAGSVDAYSFFSDGRTELWLVASDHAQRWSSSVWPLGEALGFEIASDPDFEVYFDSPEGVAPFVKQALGAWADVPTADISWKLDGVGEDDEWRERNGRNQIFVDEEADSCGGYARRWEDRSSPSGEWRTVECDVAFCGGWAEIPEWLQSDGLEDVRNNSPYLLVHEFGHCLGLGHAGDFSATGLWLRVGGVQHPGDPAMSYGYQLENPDDLSLDDKIGASLLRPQRRWERTTGSLSGVVRIGEEPAPHVHVWVLPVGERVLRDRVGVFSREDGTFLIEGLAPGEYALWAQPIASQGANSGLIANGAPTDLDDTLAGSLVAVRAGRTTEDVEISMRRGRSVRPPPDEVPPRRARAVSMPQKVGVEICQGVEVAFERPFPAEGPLWFALRDFDLGLDRWWRTRLTLDWSSSAEDVVFDWVGPYRNWWWTREDDEEKARLFPIWERGGENRLDARSPRLDVAVSDYRIEETPAGVRHSMDIAWPASVQTTLRFRSEGDACEGEPLVVCDVGGCEVRPQG